MPAQVVYRRAAALWLALALAVAAAAPAVAGTQSYGSSKSNPHPPLVAMPGTGDDFQLSSKADVTVSFNAPRAVPSDARARFGAYVDAALMQVKTDLMAGFDKNTPKPRAANGTNSSKSNPHPPYVAMPGTGDDFQLSSKAEVTISVNTPGAVPRDARTRFGAYVDAALKQVRDDLIASFDRQNRR